MLPHPLPNLLQNLSVRFVILWPGDFTHPLSHPTNSLPGVKGLVCADTGKGSGALDPALAPTAGLCPPLMVEILETAPVASISEILGSLGELKGKDMFTFAKLPIIEQSLQGGHGVPPSHLQGWLLPSSFLKLLKMGEAP